MITNRAATGATTTYDYDADDRLTRFARGGVTQQSIAYDANGNRLSLTATAGVTNYVIDPASNQLTAMTGLGAQSNAYDANGNLIKMLTASGTTSFTYDARRRLRTATVPAGWSASYGVNGLGQRVSKSAASLPTGVNRYFYDNDGNLLGEYDATCARIQEISYLAQPGEGPGTAIPVAINRAGAHYFINPDHLNSARSIGYANGQNVWTRSPSPFGEDAPNQNPSGFGTFTYNQGPFPGQYRDSETGLAYNMLRDYAPKAGRYVQSDPIGLAGGSFSTYGYVGGNPLGRVDPDGTNPLLAIPIIAVGILDPDVRDMLYAAGALSGSGLLRAGVNAYRAWSSSGSSVNSAPSQTPITTQNSSGGSCPVGGQTDFVVNSKGTAFPVYGGSGPTPVINPSGNQTGVAFTGANGGANGQVSTLRMMNPTTGRYSYPNGYNTYENSYGQAVDPYTGRTLPNANAHYSN